MSLAIVNARGISMCLWLSYRHSNRCMTHCLWLLSMLQRFDLVLMATSIVILQMHDPLAMTTNNTNVKLTPFSCKNLSFNWFGHLPGWVPSFNLCHDNVHVIAQIFCKVHRKYQREITHLVYCIAIFPTNQSLFVDI